MKPIITTLLFLLSGIYSFGQYSRSFYTDSPEPRRTSSVLEINGETYFFSIRSSDLNNLRIVYGTLNEDGETSNYQQSETTAILGENFALSGVAYQNNLVTFAIQGESLVNAQLSYAQLDITTNIITDFQTLGTAFKKGFSRSRADGSNLITYQVLESGGLQRISTSISNISSTTIEVVNNTETSTINFPSNFKNIELQIDNGIECLLIKQTVIRRVSAGNYTDALVSNFFPVGSSAIVINSSNQIVVFKEAKYAVFDQSLNQLSSGTIIGPSLITGSQRFLEAYEVNGGYRIFHGSQQSRLTEIDANFNVIKTEKFRSFSPFDTKRIGAAIYIVGTRVDNVSTIAPQAGVSLSSSSMAIIKDYLNSTPTPFTEFGQEVKLGNFSVGLGHLGASLQYNQSLETALTYEQNGLYRSVLYAATEHLVGFDSNDSIAGYSNYFGYNPDLLPGPFTTAGNYDFEEMDQYNRNFYVTQEMITDHAANISNGNPNYQMPFAIKYWPAHGESSKGQAENLAGYVDVNSNSIYDPENGDYPQIYGTDCFLSMYHQPSTAGNTGNIETHVYLFSFRCDTSETLQNTFFKKVLHFPRNTNLYDAFGGNMFDFDIGTPTDDFIGTHVELGMVYGYNSDNYDEANSSVMGFNDTIPAFGVMNLKGAKLANDGIDNAYGINSGELVNGVGFGDGIVDNEYSTLGASVSHNNNILWPSNQLVGFYNSANGLYPDGTPNIVSGTAISTRFDYFGDSDPLAYATSGVSVGFSYTEDNAGNPGGDRRMIEATGMSDLLVGDTLSITQAYIVAVDTVNLGNTALYSVNKLFERATEIKNMFQSGGTIGCGYTFNPTPLELPENQLSSVQLYPNPTNSSLTINLLNGSEMTIEVRDLNGRLVLATKKTGATATIDFSSLDNATYLVIVSSELGTKVSRVIKY